MDTKAYQTLRADIIARNKATLERDLADLDRLCGKTPKVKPDSPRRRVTKREEAAPMLPALAEGAPNYGTVKNAVEEIVKSKTGPFSATTIMQEYNALNPNNQKTRNAFSTVLIRLRQKGGLKVLQSDGREFIYERTT